MMEVSTILKASIHMIFCTSKTSQNPKESKDSQAASNSAISQPFMKHGKDNAI